MTVSYRKRSSYHWPIALSVVLMLLNVALMVLWIVFFAQLNRYSALTIGTVVFGVILIGLSFYMVLAIKEVRVNRRQANFIDSVTHELKSPIATMKLYLETLQMRPIESGQREEFYRVMEAELERLDSLITHLLEVARLDVIGEETQPEDVPLEPLLERCARRACEHHNKDVDRVFTFDAEPVVINSKRLVLEMIFGNLFDNAIKYGASDPAIDVEVRGHKRGRVVVRVSDNGPGVPTELRRKIFNLFYRGGNELQRTQKGTGLGLYIVRTLVHLLKGSVSVHDRNQRPGSTFEVILPGRVQA